MQVDYHSLEAVPLHFLSKNYVWPSHFHVTHLNMKWKNERCFPAPVRATLTSELSSTHLKLCIDISSMWKRDSTWSLEILKMICSSAEAKGPSSLT